MRTRFGALEAIRSEMDIEVCGGRRINGLSQAGGAMKHKVLLVDDEPNVLRSLQRALRKEPYEILTAESGKEGLGKLETNCVDVIVTDENMPGMTGTDFLSTVSEAYPDTIRFMLTGNPTAEVAIKAINEGQINRFFTKPCNGIDLAVTIRQALQQKELMTETRQLLRKVKEQSAVLDKLEEESPGITTVDRDERGTIIIEDDSPQSYDELIEELRKAR
ncbi:response regulator [Candidatus Hydrogenedentota bacterium]